MGNRTCKVPAAAKHRNIGCDTSISYETLWLNEKNQDSWNNAFVKDFKHEYYIKKFDCYSMEI